MSLGLITNFSHLTAKALIRDAGVEILACNAWLMIPRTMHVLRVMLEIVNMHDNILR